MATDRGDLRDVGRDLYLRGLVSTRGGNLSVRADDALLITRTGAPLGRLTGSDIIEVPVEGPSEVDDQASSDLVVHRAIYRLSDAGAVAHGHGVFATTLSFAGPITPVDHEGKLLLGEVPVFEETDPRTTMADQMGAALSSGARVVAARGHGTYAAGETIEAAAQWTTAVEMSARILIELRGAGIDPG